MIISNKTNGRTHEYHSEATILKGFLKQPLDQQIKPQAYAKLPIEGGYFDQRLDDFKLAQVISIRSGYTQVAGNLDPKADHGWSTLTTTVVEGLNILNVVTADRIVGQIITEHPLDGYVPSISFLGTHFDNLRIAGHPVDVKCNLNILGDRRADDSSYTQDSDVKERIAFQENGLGEHKGFLAGLRESYNRLFPPAGGSEGKREALECSLVNQVIGAHPGTGSGHVIRIPNFGTIVLARVTVTHEDYKPDSDVPRKTTVRLSMMDLNLGCVISGDGGIGIGSSNGGTKP